MGKLITTEQAATILNLKSRRVQVLIKNGRLNSQRIGHAYILDEDEVIEFSSLSRKVGRPKKEV